MTTAQIVTAVVIATGFCLGLLVGLTCETRRRRRDDQRKSRIRREMARERAELAEERIALAEQRYRAVLARRSDQPGTD